MKDEKRQNNNETIQKIFASLRLCGEKIKKKGERRKGEPEKRKTGEQEFLDKSES